MSTPTLGIVTAVVWRMFRSSYMMLTLAMLIWSTNWLLGRAMRAEVTPAGLAFWRWLVAAVILLPFTARGLWAGRQVLRKHWRLLVLLSLSGTALFHYLIYLALQSTTAINASLFNSATPIVIMLFSWLLYRERASGLQVAGIVVSLAGVLVVITRCDPLVLLALAINPGDLWALISILVVSLYTVLLRERPAALSPLTLLSAMAWLAALMLLPVYLQEVARGPSIAFTPNTVAVVLYLGVVPSIAAYILWMNGVTVAGPNRAGVFSQLHPLFTSIFAIALLGEALAAFHLAGFGLILAGIYLATAKRLLPLRRPTATAPARGEGTAASTSTSVGGASEAQGGAEKTA